MDKVYQTVCLPVTVTMWRRLYLVSVVARSRKGEVDICEETLLFSSVRLWEGFLGVKSPSALTLKSRKGTVGWAARVEGIDTSHLLQLRWLGTGRSRGLPAARAQVHVVRNHPHFSVPGVWPLPF